MAPRRSRRIRFEIDVLSYAELAYYVTGEHAALVLVVEPERSPTEIPGGFDRLVRLRIRASDLVTPTAEAWEARLRSAGYALNFVRRHGRACERVAVCSPDGEVRAPGLAAGLAGALDFPTARIQDLEERYPRLSEDLRRAVLRVAGKLPPSPVEKASTSPLLKAAMVLVAKITDSLS